MIRSLSVYERGDPSQAGGVLLVSDAAQGLGVARLMESGAWRELTFSESYWARTRSVRMVKRAGSSAKPTSSQVSGVETRASAWARTE